MAYPLEAFEERAATECNSVFKRGLEALPSTSIAYYMTFPGMCFQKMLMLL